MISSLISRVVSGPHRSPLTNRPRLSSPFPPGTMRTKVYGHGPDRQERLVYFRRNACKLRSRRQSLRLVGGPSAGAEMRVFERVARDTASAACASMCRRIISRRYTRGSPAFFLIFFFIFLSLPFFVPRLYNRRFVSHRARCLRARLSKRILG